MKIELSYSVVLFNAFIVIFLLNSCQKEISCENCAEKNQAPIAIAGVNRFITLPTDSVTLNGNSSSDPDGSIINFLWTKISGPGTLTITNPDSVVTKIKNLIQGVHSFELKVTDNGGLTAKDTLTITVSAAGSINQPPIAKAGPDQTIPLPTTSVTIDASGSYDPDGSIVLYSWNQIMGPNQVGIVNPSQVSALVSNMIQGRYQIELTVTDNSGLSAKDTIEIFVSPINNSCSASRPIVNAQLIPVGTLSEARQDLYTATAGKKILFGGGLRDGYFISTRVDIYDFVANTWSTAELSVGRHAMTVASVGNKILFAGGGYDDFLLGWIKFTRVDIYDALTNTWSTAELSTGRGYLTSATLGDKVFFAGGYHWDNGDHYSNRVDIYNSTTNTWSTASLSEARQGLTATKAGSKIYFAGGSSTSVASNLIDIYNQDNNSWTTSNLNEGKEYFGSIVFGNNIFWAGGITSSAPGQTLSSQVEIRNTSTQLSTFTCLSQAKASFGTVSKGNDIVFFMGSPSLQPNNFDIYNTTTQTWSVGKLDQGLNYPGIISVNNKIYVAGGALSSNGTISDKVYVLNW